jgi:hypothetical protein
MFCKRGTSAGFVGKQMSLLRDTVMCSQRDFCGWRGAYIFPWAFCEDMTQIGTYLGVKRLKPSVRRIIFEFFFSRDRLHGPSGPCCWLVRLSKDDTYSVEVW